VSKKVLILGTNTEVGKTYFSAEYCKYLISKGGKVVYLKIVQTGYPKDDDAKFVSNYAKIDEKYCFSIVKAEPPVAPASVFEKFPLIKVKDTVKKFEDSDIMILETAGGICSPLDKSLLNYHLINELNVDEVILVVPDRLGCISDALVADYLLKNEGVDYKIAFNEYFKQSEMQKNFEMINHFTGDKIKIVFGQNKLLFI